MLGGIVATVLGGIVATVVTVFFLLSSICTFCFFHLYISFYYTTNFTIFL